MIYREHLHVPWWWVIVAVLFVLSLAVAVFAYVPAPVAIWFTALAALGGGLALAAYSWTRVGVEDDAVVAGRNRVTTEWVAGVDALTGDEARAALGPGAGHRDFLFTRPFIRHLVRVRLADPADPHPAWLVSTRRPAEFAAAVERVRRAS